MKQLPGRSIHTAMQGTALLAAALILSFIFQAGQCRAAEPQVNVYKRACSVFRIPPALIMAIARTESDCNPLCITISGREYRPRSREEAIMLAQEGMRQNKSVDVGLMQINSYWIKKLGLSCRTVLEPHNNVLLAAWILDQEMRRYGRTWKAVGAYHSKKPARQRAYIKRVQKNCLPLLVAAGKAHTGAL